MPNRCGSVYVFCILNFLESLSYVHNRDKHKLKGHKKTELGKVDVLNILGM